MSEVKRYQAVHIRYEESNIRYGEGCEVDMVTASDFDKQAQEIERLKAIALAYADAGAASNELGIAGMTAGDTIRMLGAELSQLKSRQSGAVLPEHSNERGSDGELTYEAKARNACLDEVVRLNPAEQLNKAMAGCTVERPCIPCFSGKGECECRGVEPNPVYQYRTSTFISWLDCELSFLPSALAQGFETRTLYTAPPSIPETSVVVERELLKHCIAELEDWAMSFPDAESMKTYEVSAALRAILSGKGGDQNE